MSGNDESDMESLDSAPDSPCTRGCCGGCGCNCDKCFCRLDLAADNGANRDHYGNEGGSAQPIDILARHMETIRMADASFEDPIDDPNQAPQPAGPSFALTHANVHHLTQSYNEAGSYQDEWLRLDRMRVDENPFAAFISPIVETEMFDFEQDGVFGAMDLDGSMCVEDDATADNHSTMSHSTCQRSRSSRSTSQIIAGIEPTPGFVSRPLPLLPVVHLPGVAEVACPNCGGEHEYDGI